MNILTRNRVLIAGVLLLVLTNAIVITGAIINRSGEPEAVLDLSERELHLPLRKQEENSGLSLKLIWDEHLSRDASTRLKAGKLEDLGFDLINTDDAAERLLYIRKQLPKRAWIVLEFDGAHYQGALQHAERNYQTQLKLHSQEDDSKSYARLRLAEKNLSRIKHSMSRLFIVNAGQDPVQLRQQYPDKSHYIVTQGAVRLTCDYTVTAQKHRTCSDIVGYVSKISVRRIHVPLEFRTVFDSLPCWHQSKECQPSYQVKLAYGHRYEPWILDVE